MNQKFLKKFPTIEDCRLGARRRLPRFVFDFVDGGTDQEVAIARNRNAFDRIAIMPRAGRALVSPELSRSVLQQDWKVPFGLSPCGYVDLVDPGTELAMARAAHQNGAPFIASMSSITPLEELAKAASGCMWMQIQHCIDPALSRDIVERASACGVSILVLTMDIPVTSKRVRDIRNGFTLPLRPTLPLLLDLLSRPEWVLSTLKRPDPKPGNFVKYLPACVTAASAAVELEEQFETVTTWEDFEHFRSLWPGKLVAKGIVNPNDARRAAELGADGIIVSNHGGRQFDGSPASIDCLPGVVETVGDQIPVMLDSGVRSGLDVMKALLRGAALVFSGRSFYYTTGALGKGGAGHAFDLLEDELIRCMRQAGFRSVAEIAEEHAQDREIQSSA